MRLALLVSLVASASLAQGRFDRFNSRTDQGRSTRGFANSSFALFEFAPANGAGVGAPCACAAVTGAKGEAITFARSTVAECYANDGQTLTQCGVNQPVVSSGTAASSVAGIWAEPLRNNLVLQSRDLSQAIWTKTSMTCAKTATGMRNDANGASTCTASGANGTVIQALVVAASTRNTSFHLKRRTGTGAVEVTRDNGTTWTAVTASLSSTLWRRVIAPGNYSATGDVPGCAGGNCIPLAAMTSGIANPSIGIRLATSGDAVDVDFVQDEETAVPSSPIATAGTSLSRDVAYIDFPLDFSPTAATGFSTSAVMVSGGPWNAGGTAAPFLLSDGVLGAASRGTTYVWPYAATSAGLVSGDTGSVNATGLATWGPMFTAPTELSTQAGILHTGTKFSVCQRGVCDVGTAVTLTPPTFTRVMLGRANAVASTHFSGVIKQVCVDPSGRCAPTPATGPVAWVGDSIVYGNGSLPLTPPVRLSELVGKGVLNSGVGGNVVAQCGSRYLSTIAAAGYSTLVWSCAVNDLAAGTAGATIATAAQSYLADARSRGMKVIITGVMPWKNSGGWTLAKQTETVAYNSAMSTWAGANGAFYVPTIASMGGGGADPDVLLGTYDSGDLIHPNAAGALQLATLVSAQSP